MTLIDFPIKPEPTKRLDQIEWDNELGKPYGDINGPSDRDDISRHTDKINPTHYKAHPSGIECIQITEHMNFCCGNAIKYIWRHAMKGGTEDLEKAIWYLQRELKRK